MIDLIVYWILFVITFLIGFYLGSYKPEVTDDMVYQLRKLKFKDPFPTGTVKPKPGIITAPTQEDIEKRNNPKLKEQEEAMREAFKAMKVKPL